MVNPELERRFVECTELVEAWRAFLDILQKGMRQPEQVTPQLEQQFINVKARIAMLHDSFMDSLKHDKQVGSNMIAIVNRTITLRLCRKISEAEAKKLEMEWHEVFLLITETISGMKEERERLANVNEFAWRMKKLQDRAIAQFKGFLKSIWFKLIVGAAVLVGVIFGIPAAGIYDYDKLRDERWAQKAVFPVMNFMRENVGFVQSYPTQQDFTARLLALPKSDMHHENPDVTGVLPQDQLVDRLVPMMRVSGQNAEELKSLLKSSGGFARYGADSSYQAQQGFVIVFWYRALKDAQRADLLMTMEKDSLSQEFGFVRRGNVLCIVQTKDVSHRERLRNWVLKMAPR